MADPITTSVEVTSVTTTSAVAARFFPTFTFAAQTLAAGVSAAFSAARRRRRVEVSAAGGLPVVTDTGTWVEHTDYVWNPTSETYDQVTSVVWVPGEVSISKPTDALPRRRRSSPAASSGIAATRSTPRRLRRASFTNSLGVTTALALGLLRHRIISVANSAGATSVSEVPRRIRTGSPTNSAGSTNTTGTRSRMAANIIDASSVALTDSAGNIITGLY